MFYYQIDLKNREHAYAVACKPTNPNKSYTSREKPVVSTGPPTDHGKEDNEDVDSLDVVISTKEDMLIYQSVYVLHVHDAV